MAPKKNAFSIFVNCYQKDEVKNGRKPKTFRESVNILTPIWNSMSANEKDKYKTLAYESNKKEIKKLTIGVEQIINLHNNSAEYWSMKENLTNMFQSIPSKEELFKTNFILLHVNCHAHVGEHYYFPAEIAVLEFNLLNGVSRTFHRIIGISKTYPRGFAGGMREYSNKFHQINCWHEHPDDYKQILLDLLSFLKGGADDHKDLYDGTLDLPYMYALETEIGLDMMKTKSSLERLYKTVFPEHDSKRCKSIFKIGSTERLFQEIINKLNIQLKCHNVREGMSTHEILLSDMYGYGLGCQYHEVRDIAYKCSKARVLQCMSNICEHIHTFSGLTLIPGKHVAVLLRDGSRLIRENDDIPLTRYDLKMHSEYEFINNKEYLNDVICEPLSNTSSEDENKEYKLK